LALGGWDDLNVRHCGAHPLLDGRFIEATCRHFAERPVFRLCARKGGATFATLLEQRRTGVMASFSPSQNPLVPMIASDSSKIGVADIFRALPASCLRLDLYNVDPLLADFRHWQADAAEVVPTGVTISVSGRPAFEDYWARRPKQLRKNIRKALAGAEDKFEVSFRVYGEPGDVLAGLERYGDLESRGWKGREGTAIHAANAQGRFYGDLLDGFARAGGANVFELWFGGQLVASRLTISSSNMLVILKTTYDEDYAEWSPGRLLLYRCLEHLLDTGSYDTIEFYTRANRDQLAWADDSREIVNISLYRNRAMGLIASGVQLFKGSTAHGEMALDVYDDVTALPRPVQRSWESWQAGASVFLSLEWFALMQRHVAGALGAPRIFVLSNSAGEVVAILPCVQPAGSSTSPKQLASLSNYYTPVFELLLDERRISRRDAVDRLLGCLVARDDWDVIHLLPLHERGELEAWQQVARARLIPNFCAVSTVNWTARIQSIEHYRQTRPGRLRSTLRRKSARLAADGPFEYVLVRGGEELAGAIEDYQRVYAKSWKTPEPFVDFVPELIRLLSRLGVLRLGLLYVRGEPAAAQVWVVQDGVAQIYKLAYAQGYSEYSPGTLLTMHMIESVVADDRVTLIDYLTGDDRYKRDWMSESREMFSLTLCNPRRPWGLLTAGGKAGRTAVRCASRRLRSGPRPAAAGDDEASAQ
ncbi:MAG: GNAT family N-acetyltransferase, partial [Gammaproteobacteria bacterium]